MKKMIKIILAVLLLTSCSAGPEIQDKEEKPMKTCDIQQIASIPSGDYQNEASFPYPLGNDDDTLAVNSLVSFASYEGQGVFYLQIDEAVKSFDLFINSHKIEAELVSGSCYRIDYSAFSRNGKNTLQVSSIIPEDLHEAIKVYVPYPTLIQGMPEEEGFDPEALKLISDIIASDVKYGFPSAQLAIIRHGRLVYQNTWGYLNSYQPDGSKIADPVEADNDTMYDLASVTKMFAGNYPIQKLISEGRISLDDKVSEFLGERFYEDTLDFSYSFGRPIDHEDQLKWKSEICIRDLLLHQAGFPPAPRYFNLYVDAVSQEYGTDKENLLFAGYEHSDETRQATIEAICQTPLLYEPGTRNLYSDVDFMIIAAIVEQVTGMSLDEYMKKTFFEPLGLKMITFNPLENGYDKNDCAATELNGNCRDGAVGFPGNRQYTLQGEVHDEMSYYSMNGISAHAGLFANAADLAKLAYLMFNGGYEDHRFFDRNVIDLFISPDSLDNARNGLGWIRQGDDERVWYFGPQADSNTIGHQGWTGTFVMIDFKRDIVMAYLTNMRNTPLLDKEVNANDFNGLHYTASTIGFVPQIFSIGLDEDGDIHEQLLSLLASMVTSAKELVPEGANEDHPDYLNYLSKKSVYDQWTNER